MQLAALAAGLRGRGWAVRVVLPEPGPLGDRLASAGVDDVVVHPLAVLRRRLLGAGGVLRLGFEGWRERSALAGFGRGCSLVHSNTSVVVGRVSGVPHVVHVREIYAGAASGLAARAWPLWHRRLMQADARIVEAYLGALAVDSA